MADIAKRDNYVGVMSTAAAIGALALLLRAQPVSGGDTNTALMNLLIAMAADISNTNAKMSDLLDWLRRSSGASPRGWPENTEQVVIERLPCPAVGAALQLDDLEVPDGFDLVIKGDPNNPAAPNCVYVALGQANAINPNTAWPLVQNEAKSWQVKNANIFWISASAVPAWVNISLEKRP